MGDATAGTVLDAIIAGVREDLAVREAARPQAREAPAGARPRPHVPSSLVTSTSMVGRPRESQMRRA